MTSSQPRLTDGDLRPADHKQMQAEAFARDIERLKARRSEFVAVDCPACGSHDKKPAFEKYTFEYAECTDCGTYYMTPRPSPAVMSAYYSNSENYRVWAEFIFPASESARREKLHRPWLEKVSAFCRAHGIERGRMVEVGPGFGTFSALATESGLFDEVVAIEPTPELAKACRDRGVRVIEKRIEDVAADELKPADLLISFEVIEHLFEPRGFIAQCSRLVRPNGLIVLSCPNGKGFDVQMLRGKSSAVDPEHVNLFNPSSLSGMLRAAGFEILELSTPGRLDAELVRNAALSGEIDLSTDPFLKQILIDEWDQHGWPFQLFLQQQQLSAHMWLIARRIAP